MFEDSFCIETFDNPDWWFSEVEKIDLNYSEDSSSVVKRVWFCAFQLIRFYFCLLRSDSFILFLVLRKRSISAGLDSIRTSLETSRTLLLGTLSMLVQANVDKDRARIVAPFAPKPSRIVKIPHINIDGEIEHRKSVKFASMQTCTRFLSQSIN